MDTWIDIRRKARDCHQRALETANGDRRAPALIAAGLSIHDLQVEHYEPGTIVGKEVFGFLERAALLIHVAAHQDPADEAVVIAHEIGHFELHTDPRNEVTIRSGLLGGDPVDSGAGRVEGYSPRERKEIQADTFAGEFLCPSDWLRTEYVEHGRRPSEIARELQLPFNLVMNQTVRALLLAPLDETQHVPNGTPVELDESQKTAANWNRGPLLVDAGPGTGKTRTLVHRIKYLLDAGISPASILALTFSKKAAEEMRERVSAMNAEAAIEMWVGTFHSFGQELITKWPSRIGRSPDVRTLDQTGSLAVLENNLSKLSLHYYQNLYEPAYELVNVLRVISRCKDELISPAEYIEGANEDLKAAGTDEERENAGKALEIGNVYRVYEEELRRADAVDFGDLVLLSAKLIEENDDVRQEITGRFTHVLVDEYQDVNFASSRLLRALCGPETDVWVVADQRQSIYRFRGAEPTNVERFESEFGGAKHSLGTNYRSAAPIVKTFEGFSASMGGRGAMAATWIPNRADPGEVSLTVTPTLAAEAEAICQKAETLKESGVPFRDQVILGRSHLTLGRITSILEELGLPLLYLGDLFEREEIRDLLSLIAVDAEFGGIGLVRIASFAEYQVSRNDSNLLIHWALKNDSPIGEALKRTSEVDGLSVSGAQGLARLGNHLDGTNMYTSPWTLLTHWLFERSDYLRPLLNRGDLASRQKLVAIYQFLKVCAEYVALGDSSRRRFLSRIRRIEVLNEETPYRAVSSEAADFDAVRVMTIHGSKGLEFRAVHFPAIATSYMPSSWRGVRMPTLSAFARLTMQSDGHAAEEECLFFVGLSRARDHLCLSRAEKYTSRNASASRFLGAIASVISSMRFQGSGQAYETAPELRPPPVRDAYAEKDLDTYMQCPARYRYQVLEGLRGGRDDSPYVQFHRCVYKTIGWLEQEREEGRSIAIPSALARLAAVWATDGPTGHGFESYYRSAAESMIRGLAAVISSETGRYERQEWIIPLGTRNITLTPDRVLTDGDGIVHVQRIRTGRRTKSELEKPIYALLRRGAELNFAGKAISIEVLYLATRERVVVPGTNDARMLSRYSDAIAAIERGDFHAEPEPRRCPNCPCYFICGN
ncbi:MAG: UvrD-helicase domain-containing protein [Pirellulales bacterium]